MSFEENKNIVRHYQNIYNSNNLDALDEVVSKDLLTPKIVSGIPTGIAGAKAAHRIMLAGFPDYQTVIDDLFAEGDKVAARTREASWASHQRANMFRLPECISPELQMERSPNIGVKKMASICCNNLGYLSSNAQSGCFDVEHPWG
jgi:predicted ester cyclase